jgi:N-methylhydantoinase A
VAYEIVRSRYQQLDSLDLPALNAMLADITAEARVLVERGAPGQPLQVERRAYMRYVGQRHEIDVPLPSEPLQPGDADKLRAAYHAAYHEQFGRTIPKLEIEVLSWSVVVSTLPQQIKPAPEVEPVSDTAPAETRLLFDFERDEPVEASLYHRAALPPGAALIGSALIVEAETTTIVPPGWSAWVNGLGYLVLEHVISNPSGVRNP